MLVSERQNLKFMHLPCFQRASYFVSQDIARSNRESAKQPWRRRIVMQSWADHVTGKSSAAVVSIGARC